MQNLTLTESQIEYRVEMAINRLDRQFMSNQITQDQYDRDMLSLDKWAEQEYQHSKYEGKLWKMISWTTWQQLWWDSPCAWV